MSQSWATVGETFHRVYTRRFWRGGGDKAWTADRPEPSAGRGSPRCLLSGTVLVMPPHPQLVSSGSAFPLSKGSMNLPGARLSSALDVPPDSLARLPKSSPTGHLHPGGAGCRTPGAGRWAPLHGDAAEGARAASTQGHPPAWRGRQMPTCRPLSPLTPEHPGPGGKTRLPGPGTHLWAAAGPRGLTRWG